MDKCVYNTQGQFVHKSMKQIFSESFQNYLASSEAQYIRQSEVSQYIPYVNKCSPPCCSPIGTNIISDKITDVQYHNNDACTNERKYQRFRVG